MSAKKTKAKETKAKARAGRQTYRTDAMWATVPGFHDFEVSRAGNVRRKGADTCLVPQTDTSGRRYVVLAAQSGKRSNRPVAALVLAAFVGPAPAGGRPVHKDGHVGDDSLGNLRWGTRAEQVALHKAKHPEKYRGAKAAVMTPAKVQRARAMLKKMSGRAVAAHFNVARSTLADALHRVPASPPTQPRRRRKAA